MPAKGLQRVSGEDTYIYIHNKGVENRILFNDPQDYDVFLGFIKQYLSTLPDPQSLKTSFTIKGRIYKGTPHQPKNYFNAIELTSCQLLPDSFHLIIHQKASNSLASFMRSLLTRYSMYFNKKYARRGPLFDGPYKSEPISDLSKLPILVERLKNLKASVSSIPPPVPTINSTNNRNNSTNYKKPSQRAKNVKFFASSFTIFALLFAIGLMNVNISIAKNSSANEIATLPSPSPLPEPLALATEIPSPTPEVAGISIEAALEPVPEPAKFIIINITDGSERATLHQASSSASLIVGEVKNGDTLEFISKEADWYKIKLEDGTAYVSKKYSIDIENDDI